MNLYIYRTLDTDSDGDPLDFGVVRASDSMEAARFVDARLVKVLGGETGNLEFRLYPLGDNGAKGIISASSEEANPT